jgi:hypothetical protein
VESKASNARKPVDEFREAIGKMIARADGLREDIKAELHELLDSLPVMEFKEARARLAKLREGLTAAEQRAKRDQQRKEEQHKRDADKWDRLQINLSGGTENIRPGEELEPPPMVRAVMTDDEYAAFQAFDLETRKRFLDIAYSYGQAAITHRDGRIPPSSEQAIHEQFKKHVAKLHESNGKAALNRSQPPDPTTPNRSRKTTWPQLSSPATRHENGQEHH